MPQPTGRSTRSSIAATPTTPDPEDVPATPSTPATPRPDGSRGPPRATDVPKPHKRTHLTSTPGKAKRWKITCNDGNHDHGPIVVKSTGSWISIPSCIMKCPFCPKYTPKGKGPFGSTIRKHIKKSHVALADDDAYNLRRADKIVPNLVGVLSDKESRAQLVNPSELDEIDDTAVPDDVWSL